MTHWPHCATSVPLLLLILMLLGGASVCLTAATAAVASEKGQQPYNHRCTFDEMVLRGGTQPIAVVNEVLHKRMDERRAHTAATAAAAAAAEEDLVDSWAPLRIKVFTEDLRDPMKYCNETGVERPDFNGGAVRCAENDVLTEQKKTMLTTEIIPAAVQLHSARLLVKRVRNLVVVPYFNSSACSSFSVPADHRAIGVGNADIVFYAAAAPAGGTDVARGATCAVLKNGRPLVGVLTFAANYIALTRIVIRITAHEIAHALGFGYDVMRDLNMVSKIPNVRGKPFVTVVSSRKTKEKAREHYNCSGLQGMELEDEDLFRRTARSHWERRNAKDELMTGIVGAGYYTALTMAAFEDMGFFRANWGMEEQMSWGRNAGCDLLKEKCLTNNISKYPNMFCNGTMGTPFYCTTDHAALGYCTLAVHRKAIPTEYQYFTEKNLGASGNDLMDFCPVIAPYQNSWCADGEQKFLPGSRVGPNSRCLKGDSLYVFLVHIGDICAEIMCEKDAVRVRYAGDDAWYLCPEGGYITPVKTFSSGRILCPQRSEVCQDSDVQTSFLFCLLLLSVLLNAFLII